LLQMQEDTLNYSIKFMIYFLNSKGAKQDKILPSGFRTSQEFTSTLINKASLR
jgi:hypothetical protein